MVAAVGNRVLLAGVLAVVSDPPSSPPYFLQCPGQLPVGLQSWEGESLAQPEETTELGIVGESISTVAGERVAALCQPQQKRISPCGSVIEHQPMNKEVTV